MLKFSLIAAFCFNALAQIPRPVQIEPVHSYFCIKLDNFPSNTVFTASRSHFFYNDRFDPLPLPYNPNSLDFCHNREMYGDADSIFFPRLGLRSGVFNVFSGSLIVPYVHIHASSSPVTPTTSIGLAILPNVMGYEVSCPQYLGISTEALYFLTPTAKSAMSDSIFATRRELENAWYYLKNGVPTHPTTAYERTKTLYVNWPISLTPLVKSIDQQVYRITAGSTETPDRSLGCVPQTETVSTPETGSLGDACEHDTDCASLLCSQVTNRCSASEADLRSAGQSCMASSQCEYSNFTVYRQIFIGNAENGTPICTTQGFPQRGQNYCTQQTCVARQDTNVIGDHRCLR